MWNSSNVDTSIRSEFEISAAAVKKFYGIREVYFDGALDAIVTGCVKEYSFSEEGMNFAGIVTSFDGNSLYEVKIFVTDDFMIKSASCSCPEEICHHIGALALHSGFKTPLFSYLPLTRTADDDSTTNCNGVSEESAKEEIEFVKIKMENSDDYFVESEATVDADKNPKPKSRVKFITTDHVCRICNKMYADSHHLRIHEAKEHPAAANTIQIAAFMCRICSKMFLESDQLHVHQCNEHTVTVDPVPISSASS